MFFSSFLVWLLLPTHCRCRGLLLYPIRHSDTHTHTHSSWWGIYPSYRPLMKTHNIYKRLLNVKPGGTYSNHWALEGWRKLVLTLGPVIESWKYQQTNITNLNMPVDSLFQNVDLRLSTSQRHTKFLTKLSTQSTYLTTSSQCSTILRLFYRWPMYDSGNGICQRLEAWKAKNCCVQINDKRNTLYTPTATKLLGCRQITWQAENILDPEGLHQRNGVDAIELTWKRNTGLCNKNNKFGKLTGVFSQRREIHFVIITDTSANKHKPVCLSSADGNVSETELYKIFEHIMAVK
jgi:hypothetical protein